MNRFTPGPWTLETVRTSCGICHKIGPFPGREEKEVRHACLYADYPSEHNPADQELLANAQLMTLAPGLLAALKALLPYAESRAEDMHAEACITSKSTRPEAVALWEKANAAVDAAHLLLQKIEGEDQ